MKAFFRVWREGKEARKEGRLSLAQRKYREALHSEGPVQLLSESHGVVTPLGQKVGRFLNELEEVEKLLKETEAKEEINEEVKEEINEDATMEVKEKINEAVPTDQGQEGAGQAAPSQGTRRGALRKGKGTSHPGRVVNFVTKEGGQVATRAHAGPLYPTAKAVQKFFEEASTCALGLEAYLPGCKSWYDDALNALWDVAAWDVKPGPFRLGVCVVAAGRPDQAMKSLPHLCMQVLRHASRVRVHVAIFREDERLLSWLMEVLEALIITKTVMIWYAEDVELWHDADWKNALHAKAIAQGATVVPRE